MTVYLPILSLPQNKGKRFLEQVKFRNRSQIAKQQQEEASSCEFDRILLTDLIPVCRETTGNVQALLENPHLRRIYVRMHREQQPQYSTTNPLLEAYIYSTEQVAQLSLWLSHVKDPEQSEEHRPFIIPPRHYIHPPVTVVVAFDGSWTATPLPSSPSRAARQQHKAMCKDFKRLLRCLLLERTVIQLLNAPMAVRVWWTLVVRWHFRAEERERICFVETWEETETEDLMDLGPGPLRFVTKPAVQGGVLSDGYISERIRL